VTVINDELDEKDDKSGESRQQKKQWPRELKPETIAQSRTAKSRNTEMPQSRNAVTPS